MFKDDQSMDSHKDNEKSNIWEWKLHTFSVRNSDNDRLYSFKTSLAEVECVGIKVHGSTGPFDQTICDKLHKNVTDVEFTVDTFLVST